MGSKPSKQDMAAKAGKKELDEIRSRPNVVVGRLDEQAPPPLPGYRPDDLKALKFEELPTDTRSRTRAQRLTPLVMSSRPIDDGDYLLSPGAAMEIEQAAAREKFESKQSLPAPGSKRRWRWKL